MSTDDSTNKPMVSSASLAGLVSPEAELLYERLNVSGSVPIGTGPGEIDIDTAAYHELADADLVYSDPGSADRVQVVSPTTALTILLSRRQQELMASHERVIRGWSALESLLRVDPKPLGGKEAAISQTIEVIRDRPAISALSVELYMSTRQELCTTTRGVYSDPVGEHQLLTPPKPSVSRGARFRNIYDGDFASSPAGARIIEQSLQCGEEARIRATLPTKMLLVDRRIALVALNDTGMGAALVVRSPQLLALLYEWFEMV